MQIDIPLGKIRPGRFQPRQVFDREKLLSLAESIKAQGLINPIIVFVDEEGHYELVAGERRWRASIALAMANRGDLNMELEKAASFVCEKEADWLVKNLPFLMGYNIRAEKRSADDMELLHQVAFVDNIQRHDLSPVEEGQALLAMKQQYGHSIRKLAELTGLSKSYVEDRLKLAENLSPEVASMVGGQNGSGPALDLTLARDLARKLPADMQPAVVDYLKVRAEKAPVGEETTKKQQAAISRMAAFMDPERWNLPADHPWPPVTRNRARLLAYLVATADRAKLAAALIKLDQPEHSWDSDGGGALGKKTQTILEGGHDFYRIVNTIAGGNWDSHAPERGWTCATCVLASLAKGIDLRDPELDQATPCLRLRDPGVATCEGFIGPDDPVTIPVPSTIFYSARDDSGYKSQIKQSLGFRNGYVESWFDYALLYGDARQERARLAEERAAQAKQAHLAPLALYWQAQEAGRFDLENFQAHACRKCRHHTGEENPASFCRFIHEPIPTPHFQNQTRAPKFGILEAGTVRVPRCEKFSYVYMPEIKPLAGWRLPDRKIILDWFERLTAERHYEDTVKTWDVLGWLPGLPAERSLTELWKNLDDERMMALLRAGVSEARAARHWSPKAELFDPTTGKITTWQAGDFKEKPVAQKKPAPKPANNGASPGDPPAAPDDDAGEGVWDFTDVTTADLHQTLADLRADDLPLSSPYARRVLAELAARQPLGTEEAK